MRLATLLGPDLKATLQNDPDAIQEALEEFHPEDIAEIVEDLPLEDSTALLRVLTETLAADVLERLPPDTQTEVLAALGVDEAAELLSEMSPDDRADLVQELQEADEDVAGTILAHLEEHEPEVAEEVRELSAYAEDVAGGLMTPDYVGLAPDVKIWQAIEEVRRMSQEGEAETISYLYVLYGQKLVGVVSVRDLILADPGQTLGDIATENVVSVRAADDQELVAQTIAKYDFSAIPVVDEQNAMLGVVTVDDVVDVVIEEATEDVHMMGAVSPMDEGYFDSGLFRVFRSRVLWLTVLFFGGFVTAAVMERYQLELRTVIALAVFVPLIISSGGNAGSQSASLTIRALAVGEVEPGDWWRVLSREAFISIALGCVLGLFGFARVYFFDSDPSALVLSAIVACSTLSVVVVGSLVGALLPLAIQRVGLDPAVSSTPFIASLVDVVGLLIYLTIAKAFLHI